jgi:hypothetical protein
MYLHFATIACYGTDNKRASKVVVGIISRVLDQPCFIAF